MRLSDEERQMLDGRHGEALRRSMEGLVQLGDAFGAPDMVRIGYAHVHPGMALYAQDVELMEELVRIGARVTQLTVAPDQREVRVPLRRFRNMNAEGWYSGDTHVHFMSAVGSQMEARGEDLNVVNLLAAQWGNMFTDVDQFTGTTLVSPDGRTITRVSQENRQHFLGHLNLLGLTEPVYPLSSDGPVEAELGGTLEVLLSDLADRCHAQGGTVVSPHMPFPNGELAALVATGRVDAVETGTTSTRTWSTTGI